MIWNKNKKIVENSILIDKRTQEHISKAAHGLKVVIDHMTTEKEMTGYDLSTYTHALDGIRIALKVIAGEANEELQKESVAWVKKNEELIAEIESTSN